MVQCPWDSRAFAGILASEGAAGTDRSELSPFLFHTGGSSWKHC
jgi:hypothetical protein